MPLARTADEQTSFKDTTADVCAHAPALTQVRFVSCRTSIVRFPPAESIGTCLFDVQTEITTAFTTESVF